MDLDQAVEKIFSTAVRQSNGCLLTKGTHSAGYGQIFVNGKARLSHQVVYEWAYGPVVRPPEARGSQGPVIRHTCDTPNCVEPIHLVVGTQGDNMRDAIERGRFHRNPQRTHCKRGHPMTGDNVRENVRPDGRVARHCHACAMDRQREWRAAKSF